MAKKGRAKKLAKLEAAAAVEDLDLDVSDVDKRTRFDDEADDEDVVHDRRGKKSARRVARHEDSNEDDSGDELVVLPSDAHKLDGYGDEEFGGAGGGSYQEEEELALATEKTMRKKVTDDDFAVAGVTLGSVKAAASATKKKKVDLEAAPVIEAVERDFASLTTSERLAILKKESPELLKMLEDVKRYLGEVKELAKPLHELLYERKVAEADRNLVMFLETKVQLLLSYCMHVTFYLLLKSEGKKVSGHPVIDRLVEIRVYLEKMWPLEEKLQYSLNRLLSGKGNAAAAHVSELRPLQSTDSGLYESTRSAENTEARDRRKQLREQREAEELEKEEQSAMTRVRTKKASALNTLPSAAIAPLSYQEDEDQYFAKMTGRGLDEDEDDTGLSLMDALRKRQRQQQALQTAKESARKPAKNGAGNDEEEGGEGNDDGDDDDDAFDEELDEEDILAMEGGESDGDEEANYDALLEEENARAEKERAQKKAPREKLAVEEVDRRKIGKDIESHRGLTKARPKDRKTPRVAQRRKYERGLRVHKTQSRQFKAEPEGGFAGVRAVKAGVVRGKSLL